MRQHQRMNRGLRNTLLWLGSVAVFGLIGAWGYMGLEGWSFFDSLYMAVITLATVGFKEIHPMGRGGEIWTMVLSIAAVAVIFGTVGVATEAVAGEIGSGKWEKRRMQHGIDKLTGHFIVVGYGRVGSLVAKELRLDGESVVVLDVDASSVKRAEDDGFLVVPGDGTSDEVLQTAGVARARGLVAAIDSDSQNVYVTISARAMNPDLFIIGRGSTSSVMKKLTQAGADRAISPYRMAGGRIVQLALKPGVVDFLDAAMRNGGTFGMDERLVSSALAGVTVGEFRDRGLHTLAIQHADGSYEPNPPDARAFAKGESLILSGSQSAIDALDA